MDSRAAARISEAQRPLDPMERFAGESQARRKEYNAAYYQKNKARLVAEQRKYRANPHSKAKKKEYDAKRRATPHHLPGSSAQAEREVAPLG